MLIGGNCEMIIKMHSSSENWPWDPFNFVNGEIDETEDTFDENGKRIKGYSSVASLFGYLDLISGDSRYDNKAKIEDSTHIFICDYLKGIEEIDIEEAKALVNNQEYGIKYIDDVMGLHEHLEIYLKKVGGQNASC